MAPSFGRSDLQSGALRGMPLQHKSGFRRANKERSDLRPSEKYFAYHWSELRLRNAQNFPCRGRGPIHLQGGIGIRRGIRRSPPLSLDAFPWLLAAIARSSSDGRSLCALRCFWLVGDSQARTRNFVSFFLGYTATAPSPSSYCCHLLSHAVAATNY